MIANDAELQQTRNQLSQLEHAIAELRDHVYVQNPERFRLMAESYLDEIEKLRTRIDEYIGVELARDVSTDFIVRIRSPLLTEGTAPASVVSRTVDALQRGLQRMGEFVARAQFNVPDVITHRRLIRQFQLDVVVITSGSFQVGLRVTEEEEPSVSRESVKEAIRRFSEALRYAQREENREAFQRLVPDVNFQLQVLQSLKEMAPSRRRKDYDIEFRGGFLRDEPIVFKTETRAHIAKLIRATTEEAHDTGVVREINLENRTFHVKTRATTLRCRYPARLEQEIKRTLDKGVEVFGVAKVETDGKIKYVTVRRVRIVERTN